MLASAKRIEAVEEVTYMALTENVERRKHRRHDLADQELPVYAVVGGTPGQTALGQLLDISPGGLRFKTPSAAIRPNTRLALQLTLPSHAGLRAFVDALDEDRFATEWAGHLSVTRVIPLPDGTFEVAGKLLDMSDGERGLLGLYLSTQPLAA